MIRTSDATAAMRWMVAARRLGLDPVAHGGPVWELETARGGELGDALYALLVASDPAHDRMFTSLELQEYVDERNAFHDSQAEEWREDCRRLGERWWDDASYAAYQARA